MHDAQVISCRIVHADVAYADDYSAEGCTNTIYYTPVGDIYNETQPTAPQCDTITAYQPRWDTFGRLISNTVNTSSVRIPYTFSTRYLGVMCILIVLFLS